MAFVAGLIALEKTLPWRRVATYGTAAALLALGVLLFAAPHAIPGLTIPSNEPDARDGTDGLLAEIPDERAARSAVSRSETRAPSPTRDEAATGPRAAG